MKRSLIVLCVLLAGQPSQARADEVSRVELVIDRGEHLVGGAKFTERLRLDLRTGAFQVRSDGVDVKGKAKGVAASLSDLLALDPVSAWPSEFTPDEGGRSRWKYVLRLYPAGSSKPSKIVQGELPGPSFSRGRGRLPEALRTLLALRKAKLTPAREDAAALARFSAMPKTLYGEEPQVLLIRVQHYAGSGSNRETVSATCVFRDGRVELRGGVNRADLETPLRFRVPKERCKALSQALRAAKGKTAAFDAKSGVHSVFASPRLSKPVVVGESQPAAWKAVDETLTALLGEVELRGVLATQNSMRLNRSEESKGAWPVDVPHVRLSWEEMDRAQIDEVIDAPGPVRLGLVGRYSLPMRQRYSGQYQPIFSVTAVEEGPRRFEAMALEVIEAKGGLRLAVVKGQGIGRAVAGSDWLKLALKGRRAGDQMKADGWLRRKIGDDVARFEVEGLWALTTGNATRTHVVRGSGLRTSRGKLLSRGEQVRVTGATQRGERVFLRVGKVFGFDRMVIGSALDFRPASTKLVVKGAEARGAREGLTSHLETRFTEDAGRR